MDEQAKTIEDFLKTPDDYSESVLIAVNVAYGFTLFTCIVVLVFTLLKVNFD